METRTAAREHETGQRPQQKVTHQQKTVPDTWFGRGTRILRWAATPAMEIWEEYLRDPLARGLITTGAVLTETGRLMRNTRRPQSRSEKRRDAAAAKKAEEKILH